MMRWFALIVLVALPAYAEDERRARLDKGDILTDMKDLPGSDLPEVTMTAVVDAPPEKLWEIISHCANYPRTMTRIKEAHELSREGDHVRCETIFDSPWPLPTLRSITRAQHTVSA